MEQLSKSSFFEVHLVPRDNRSIRMEYQFTLACSHAKNQVTQSTTLRNFDISTLWENNGMQFDLNTVCTARTSLLCNWQLLN